MGLSHGRSQGVTNTPARSLTDGESWVEFHFLPFRLRRNGKVDGLQNKVHGPLIPLLDRQCFSHCASDEHRNTGFTTYVAVDHLRTCNWRVCLCPFFKPKTPSKTYGRWSKTLAAATDREAKILNHETKIALV